MNKDNQDSSDVTPDIGIDGEEETTEGTTYVTVPDFTQFTEEYVRANVSFQNNFDIIYSYDDCEKIPNEKYFELISILKNENLNNS